MSLESALTVSLSGLKASSTQLELTASNISNSSVEGYTKKSVVLSSATLGTVGGGTQVTGFTRSENAALFKTLTTSTTDLGQRTAQDSYLQQVQDILGTGSSDNPALSENISSFVNAWTQYASTPESLVSKSQVIQDGVNLTDEVRRLSDAVEDLDRQCKNEINSTLQDLNGYLEQIRDLNAKISQAVTANLSAGDVEDQRDQLVLKVAAITGVTILERNFGQIALYTSTGYQLVDGASIRTLSYNGTDVTDASNTTLSLNTALSGGSLQALIDFRATTTPASSDPATSIIQKLRSQLDTVVTAFTSVVTTAASGEVTFAQAYNAATTTGTELANSFFTGVNRTNFYVNASLLDGTAQLKQAAASPVTDAMLDATRTFTTDGLNATSVSYASYVTASFTTFQQAATNIATLKGSAEDSNDYLQEKYSNETAVNVDDELVKLTTFQNAYAASAHAMTVVKELFMKLENLL